jgi:energy-coupling factor transporter ATP-binding protein EcfA2
LPTLVLVTGAPGSGKTTLAVPLARHPRHTAATSLAPATDTPGIWITCPPTNTRQPSRGSRLALPGQSLASTPAARWTSRPWPHGSRPSPDGTTAIPSHRSSAADPQQLDTNTLGVSSSFHDRRCRLEDATHIASVLVSDLSPRSTQDNHRVDLFAGAGQNPDDQGAGQQGCGRSGGGPGCRGRRTSTPGHRPGPGAHQSAAKRPAANGSGHCRSGPARVGSAHGSARISYPRGYDGQAGPA